MPIEKLEEFARDGQKNTDELILTDGFPRPKFPARQWFNYLFNMLSLKINEIIDLDPVARSEIVDNLTTNDATKPVSAKQAKVLQDNKLGKTENAVSATKLATARTIGGVSFDGSANINLPGVNTAGNQSTTGNAATATKLQTARTIAISGAVTGTATGFDGSANIEIATTAIDGSEISTGTIPAARIPAASTSAAGAVKLNNTLTSTSTTEALTAAQGKVLLEMFASSHTQNGYQKIANPLDPSKPLIIQWGKPGIINPGTTINFPIAFPNQVFIIIASDYDGSSVIGSTGWTLTNFKSRSNSAIAYNWFAVGF